MNRSQELAKLAPALRLLQDLLKPIAKTAQNPFYNSQYAPLEEIIEATRGPLAANGLMIVQTPCTIYVSGAEGSRTPVPGLSTTLLHESGEFIEDQTPLVLTKQDPQGHGAAITYMRRAAYCAMLNLATESDDDGNAASGVGHAVVAQNGNATPHVPPKPTYQNAVQKMCVSCSQPFTPKAGTESYADQCFACYKAKIPKGVPRPNADEIPF